MPPGRSYRLPVALPLRVLHEVPQAGAQGGGGSARELIREICRTHDIVIVKGHVRPDHVHLLALRSPRTCRRPSATHRR
ncbi:MAG: transposase [Myxococcales bacterium]|nr:transposase [Myxococcales bacterium]MCB9581301.1 transposase [Polyangiaceae bacterium]